MKKTIADTQALLGDGAYDAVRDLALSPAESRKFILRMLEEVPCDPST